MTEYYLPPYLLMSMTDEQKQAIADIMRTWEHRVNDLNGKNHELEEQVNDLQNSVEMFSAEREELIEMMARFQGVIMDMATNTTPLPSPDSLSDTSKKILYAFRYSDEANLSLKTLSESVGLERVAVLMATSELTDLNLIRCSNLDDVLANHFRLTERGKAMLALVLEEKS